MSPGTSRKRVAASESGSAADQPPTRAAAPCLINKKGVPRAMQVFAVDLARAAPILRSSERAQRTWPEVTAPRRHTVGPPYPAAANTHPAEATPRRQDR